MGFRSLGVTDYKLCKYEGAPTIKLQALVTKDLQAKCQLPVTLRVMDKQELSHNIITLHRSYSAFGKQSKWTVGLTII